ncbi:MAG: 4-aminobutyrate--2-oxoglutarate transaminase [Deltaproteobacteria bacterium]|nr:4-aminobutyrate--2-oxoglutarate transaminase [Deltaproteobacteria bacterium]
MSTINLKTQVPGPKSKELMELRRKHVARGPFHATPVFMSRAKGAVIEDVDGNTFLDLAAGLGVANVGHAPETVVKAIQDAAAKVLHAGFNVTPYESYVTLSAVINRTTPGSFAKKTLLVNSGSEAVENAVKIARAFTNRQAVVCFEHGFHGRTYMAMTLTSKVKPYKVGFGPFNPEVYRAPFPYAYRWPNTSDPSKVSQECFKRFEELVNNQVGAANVAAVIIEPVLGEGGFVAAPREFLAKLREFCTANGIVLIADEIQTGFGRTGTLFACEQLGVEPDLITLAKGLGGGMPLAAVCGRAEIMDAPVEGGIGGTYGGNPVAVAASLAVFELFEKGGMLTNAKRVGELLQSRLRGWAEKYPVIGEARGLGPMQALELVKDRATKEPNREATAALARYCYEHGVVLLTAGTYGNVARFLAPLAITSEQLTEALDVVEAGLKTL